MVLRQKTADLRLQDLNIGDTFDLGDYLMSREKVYAFASEYDAQPFHLSDEGAVGHPIFKRMAASGWHTVVAMQNKLADLWKGTKIRGLAGSGVERIKWLAPVYVGENLRCMVEIADIRPSASRPGRASITMLASMQDESGARVCEMALTGVFLTLDQDEK
ncbi:acyl dehydratase [Niveispirillum sp. SYP-B3756]|uniref:MaoC/PaaZ C-terminal domain-containing protein n=1 Tax=Niveispirillum sp. SYP-B3756 TaxID=2662178 RepID=UPI0012919AC9|nr:MaoC/PaaZ C-terminal domain-containing protein [Niveispirillum sp. SYP-B3756]MQP68611.1 acyl dehydratase [Niveispirillum sp. SYP-B3756]